MPSDVVIQSRAKSVWPPPHIGPDEEGLRYHLTVRLLAHYKLVIRKNAWGGEVKTNLSKRKDLPFFYLAGRFGHGVFRVQATAPVVTRHVSAVSESRKLRAPRCRSCRGGEMGDVGQHPLHIRFAAAVAGDLAAAVHGHDDIGDPEHLFKVRGCHDDAIAVRAELSDQAIDVRTRPHVDATRRLVHKQHAGCIADCAAEGELLLVAAAELIGWRSEPRAVEPHGIGQS